MINLTPPNYKEGVIYGRRNRILVRWIFATLLVLVGISAMAIFGQLFINNNVKSLESVAKITQDRINSQDLASTQKDIQALSNNFTTVTQLLSKQVLFSKIFIKIGSIMPNGAILNGITLSTTNTSLDLIVAGVDREAATQAFVNINDPKNGLFDKADLISVTCQTPSTSNTITTQSKYPCIAKIKVTIKTDSSFYFLSSLTNKTDGTL